MQGALLAAMSDASVSVKRMDMLPRGGTALDEPPDALRKHVLMDERELDEMSRSELVIGHFSFQTLTRIAPPEAIATVLREPRARLLSLYAYWRLTPAGDETWNPVRAPAHALRPLDEFLSEPQLAGVVDNVVCRMLLSHTRIPELGFIPAEDIEGVASDAIDLLDQLGFVGVLERGQATWEGLSRFFGVTLAPARANVTGSAGIAPNALPIQQPISDRTLDLLHARTAADALVYTHALRAESTEVQAKQISDSACAAQLIQLGDIACNSAASAQSLAAQLSEAQSRLAALAEELSTREDELKRRDEEIKRRDEELNAQHEAVRRLQDELALHRECLDGIEGSASWRVTAPARAAKRGLMRLRS